MQQLRDNEKGCPWDVEQDFASIAPHTLEEAYEVVDAIEKNDMQGLREELGDLLFQVVFHAQMAEEKKLFTFDDVVEGVYQKMVSRHPHVFGDEIITSAKAQTEAWEKHKLKEKALTHYNESKTEDILADITVALPAMTRALKIQKKAARAGFDWTDIKQVFEKLDEEIAELTYVLNHNLGKKKALEEIGDMIFCCVNIARKLEVDPEEAVRFCNQKFINRFRHIQEALNVQNITVKEASLQELNDLWDRAKIAESTAESNKA